MSEWRNVGETPTICRAKLVEVREPRQAYCRENSPASLKYAPITGMDSQNLRRGAGSVQIRLGRYIRYTRVEVALYPQRREVSVKGVGRLAGERWLS